MTACIINCLMSQTMNTTAILLKANSQQFMTRYWVQEMLSRIQKALDLFFNLYTGALFLFPSNFFQKQSILLTIFGMCLEDYPDSTHHDEIQSQQIVSSTLSSLIQFSNSIF